MSEFFYEVTVNMRCLHCGKSLAEKPTTYRWPLTVPSMQWVTARPCDCELARATDLPYIRTEVMLTLATE